MCEDKTPPAGKRQKKKKKVGNRDKILLELLAVPSGIIGFMPGSCKPSLWHVGISWDFFFI